MKIIMAGAAKLNIKMPELQAAHEDEFWKIASLATEEMDISKVNSIEKIEKAVKKVRLSNAKKK